MFKYTQTRNNPLRKAHMDKQSYNEANLTSDIDYQLWILLDHLRYMIFKARKRELARYEMTPEQAQILLTLGRSDSFTINQLVEYTQHLHHSVSTMINRMEKKGLVSKMKIPGKGRKLNIKLTEKGHELLRKMARDSFGRILICLSEDEKKVMIDYLSRLMISSYKVLGRDHTPLCIEELEQILNPHDSNLPE